MNRSSAIVFLCILTGCTAVLVPRDSGHQPTKITVEQGISNQRPNTCGVYIPLPYPKILSVEEYIQDIDIIDKDSDLAVEVLLNYIKFRNEKEEDYRIQSDTHYRTYLKNCQ